MHIWEVHVWEMYVSKVQLACECVRGIWEIFDVAGGAECRKAGATVAHRTAKAPTAAHREFAAIRIRTRIRSPATKCSPSLPEPPDHREKQMLIDGIFEWDI